MVSSRSALLLTAALAGAAPATAAPLAFEGSLSLEFPGLVTCLENPPAGEVACGWPLEFRAEATGVAEVGPGGAIALAGGTFAVADSHYISDNYGPSLYPIHSIAASVGNGPGQVGAAGGTMPLLGLAKLCLFAPCETPPPANISIPLSVVGAGGGATHSGAVNVTVLGAAWTAGTITLDSAAAGALQIAGFAHGAASNTSSVAAPGGTLSLVTPIAVSTSIATTAYFELTYARLTLQFVPEPGTAGLLGVGLLALVQAGRRRAGSA